MKNTYHLRKAAALGITAMCAATAFAISPSYPSSDRTDVQASDSVRLYPEEQQRERLLKESRVIFAGGDAQSQAKRDSAQRLMSKFYVDQFRHSQDPDAPMFTFMSKNANLAMGIGATVKLSGWFDWNGYIPGADFSPYNIEMPKNPGHDKSLHASASNSNIFFSLLGSNEKLGNYRIYIEGGFSGYANEGFKLKKAWVQIRDFTAGLATSTFSDPASEPEVLDPAGGNGKASKTNMLVRYMKTFKNKWSVAGSLEFPSSQPDVSGGDVSKHLDYVPDFAALGQYQWDRGLSHIRLAALVRTMSYTDLTTHTNHSVTGWGALLGSAIKIGRQLTFTAQGSAGQGISAYTGDLSNGNYDLLADPKNPGRLYAPTTLAGTLGLKYYWMPNLNSTVALSTLRNYAKEGTHDSSYKYGQYLAANLVYNITPRIQIGMEYLAGKRMNFDGSHANANRLQALFTASF